LHDGASSPFDGPVPVLRCAGSDATQRRSGRRILVTTLVLPRWAEAH